MLKEGKQDFINLSLPMAKPALVVVHSRLLAFNHLVGILSEDAEDYSITRKQGRSTFISNNGI